MKKPLYDILMSVFMALVTIGLCLIISLLTGWDFWYVLTGFILGHTMEMKWRMLNDK